MYVERQEQHVRNNCRNVTPVAQRHVPSDRFIEVKEGQEESDKDENTSPVFPDPPQQHQYNKRQHLFNQTQTRGEIQVPGRVVRVRVSVVLLLAHVNGRSVLSVVAVVFSVLDQS